MSNVMTLCLGLLALVLSAVEFADPWAQLLMSGTLFIVAAIGMGVTIRGAKRGAPGALVGLQLILFAVALLLDAGQILSFH